MVRLKILTSYGVFAVVSGRLLADVWPREYSQKMEFMLRQFIGIRFLVGYKSCNCISYLHCRVRFRDYFPLLLIAIGKI